MSFGQHPTVLSPPSSPTPFFNQILPPLTTRRPRIRLIHNKPLPSDTDDWIDGTMEHGSDGPGHSHSHGNLYRSHPSVPRVPIIQVGRRYPAGSQLAAMFPGDPVRPGEKARSQAEIDEERKQQEKYKPKDPDNLRDEYGRKLSPFRIMTDDGPIRPPPSPKKQKMADDEMDGETKMPDNKPAKPADHARSPLSHAALQLYWFIFRFGGLKDRGITTMMLLNFLNEFFSYELDHADIAEMDELVGRYTPNLYDAEDDFYKTDPGELYAVESIYSADKKMRDIFCNLDETEAGQLFALQESIYFADTKMRDKFQNFIYQLEGLVGMEHVDLYFCGPRENIELLKSTPALYKEAQYRKRYNWTVIIGWFKVNLRPEKFIVPDGDGRLPSPPSPECTNW